jgi:4-amino-4-deoxy-L-arabinose transferase-like glycosyltransferase
MALSSVRPVTAGRALAPPFAARLAVGSWLDVPLAGAFVVLAGVVRWPHLLMSPQFPSVGDTIMMALDVAEGRAFYLHDAAPYLGAPFIWLLALVYRLAGPSIEATMLLAWALGALTIVPTYLLGREVGGRGGGVIAAAFLATSGAHTVVTSHVPLSHSLTPLVSTTALWLVARAARRARASLRSLHVTAGDQRDVAFEALPLSRTTRGGPKGGAPSFVRGLGGGGSLALAGLLAGLALQTHPTSAPLLVGAALGALLTRPGWLRTRWPAVALALVVVGYGSLLAYHLTSRFEIVADVQSKQERYLDADDDAGEEVAHGVYLNNLEQVTLATTRLVSGAIAERPTRADYLLDPWVVATVGLALGGLVVAARRRQWWLVGAVGLAIFLPPVFSGKYRPILDGRYLMPLVPVLFAAIGLAVATAARSVAAGGAVRRAGGLPSPRLALGPARAAAVLLLSVGTALLAAHPLALLDTFYEDSQEDGFSNALYLRTLHQLEAARQADEAVLLDPLLANVKSTGGGKASSSFTFLLALEHIPNEPLDAAGPSADLAGRLAILHRATAERLGDDWQLEPLDGKRVRGKDSASYRAYRIGTVEASRH